MSFRRARESWEWLARREPVWAICTDHRKRHGQWELEEFFETGEREVDAVFRYLERKRIVVPDRSGALDFGSGRLTRALSRCMDEVDGVDISPTMIELAQRLNADEPGKKRFELNVEPYLLRFPEQTLSFIYSSIVLSPGYVSEFVRVLKPRGVLVFQMPTLDRAEAAWKLLRTLVRHAVQRARLPFPHFYMEMNVIPEARIRERADAGGCEILDVVTTNSIEAESNGTLEFLEADPGAVCSAGNS